ncbi:MAG TPA: hypothetical protein VLH38_03350 [Patescibacteria group bacterium]|nr:hypothetical protein [Patescibacteria group bacterium]
MTPDLVHAARQLAKKLLEDDVDADLSYEHIRKSYRSMSGPSYRASIGGWLRLSGSEGPVTIPNTKIIVYVVNGVTVNQIFSLKEIFDECKQGQTALL